MQAMSRARFDGLRLAQAQSFSTSTSSLISLIFSGPLSRITGVLNAAQRTRGSPAGAIFYSDHSAQLLIHSEDE
ncbi:hypothetical protein GCM10010109_86230 [Actinoplanes campanulatus]|nr:hypothetical protein GCM10010109_86230 [Actinoplanes campanulatus]GID41749.1 hypothetical protein Aca09nite_82550 [Actinoplanes campanulatus]